MGLDMYLYATKYISDYKHQNGEQGAAYRGVLAAVGLDGFRYEGTPGLTVQVTVAYWRKANAIHKWFVEHCQNGADDCGTYDVGREQLQELMALCQEVLGTVETVPGQVLESKTYCPDGRIVETRCPGTVVADEEFARAMLPTKEGFFFGKTDYDEDYLAALRATVQKLKAILSDERFADWTFEYHSSW